MKIVFTLLSLLLLYGCFEKKDKKTQDNSLVGKCFINSDINSTNTYPFDPSGNPYFRFAWHLDTKTTSLLFKRRYFIVEGADLNISDAWKITRGKDIKVAIIDDSFEITHEDIKDNVILAYDVDEDDCDVSDYSPFASHGHMVSGVLAATNNKLGVIGIAPEVSLILIKQIETDDAKTIKAFEYAKQNGARVISCSWGSENVSEAVKAKIDELYDEGIVIVFAFGNEGLDFDSIDINDESELSSVIGVGSSDESNKVALYSNYGSQLDILAPSGEIGVPTVDKMGVYGDTNQLGFLDNNYTFFKGTSASAPLVAGTVALMLSVNDNLTPKEVREILIQSADKIDDRLNYDENGFNIYAGYGKINSSKAILKAIEYKNMLK